MSVSNIIYKISAIDLISGTLMKINAQTDALDGKMTTLGKTINAVFAIGTIIEFGKAIFDAGTKVENAKIGLTTVLRDSAAAQEVINQAMRDAPKTPFDLVNLIEGEQKLISAGSSAKDARTDFLNLGNAVATSGGDMNAKMNSLVIVMQKIQNRGKATQREMNQFATQGINVLGMLQRQGVQVYDQNGKVKVSYEQITEGLAKAAAKGGQFEGALAAMGESISTKLSNVRDNITNIFVNLFEAGKGLFGPVLDGLNSVLSFIAEITKPGTGMDILIFLIRTVTNALIIQAGMWLVINAEVIALTISTWALFAAENAALLGIPLLIAGFGWLADKVGGVTNAFKVLANVGILALDIILAPFKFLYDLAKTGSIGEAFDIMVSDYKAAIGGVTGAYNEGVAEVDAANKKKSLAEKARAANYHPSAIPDNMGGGKDKGSAANKVQAPKITTINITIGNLVNELMVQTTNLKESPSQLREAIINILGGAINDSQLIVK